VIDTAVSASSALFAVRASSSSSTLFLSGEDIRAYLGHLETDEIKVQEVDFRALKAESSAAATTAPKLPANDKEDAKVEGAVQIAIGVKKEVDFAAWYTNVRMRLILNSLLT
jgi:prolyl-tRNA synthetase